MHILARRPSAHALTHSVLAMSVLGAASCTSANASPATGREPTWFEDAKPFSGGIAPFKRDGKWGYLDRAGKIIVPPQFDTADVANADGYAFAGSANVKRVVSPTGALSPPITATWFFTAPVLYVEVDKTKAVVDVTTGALSSPFASLDEVPQCPLLVAPNCVVGNRGTCIADSLAAPNFLSPRATQALKKADRVALFDCKSGALKTGFDALAFVPLADGRLWVQTPDHKWSLRDTAGKVVIPPFDSEVIEIDRGTGDSAVTQTRIGKTFGMVVHDHVVAPAFTGIMRDVIDGRIGVEQATGDGYVDEWGKVVVPTNLARSEPFSTGLAAIQRTKGGAWSYIDPDGKEVIPPSFDYATDFANGFAAVEIAKRWGYIDRSGAVVVPAAFDSATAIEAGGVASAVTDGHATCLYMKGKTLTAVATPFAAIGRPSHGLAIGVSLDAATKRRTCGYVDDHCAIVGPTYQKCEDFDEFGVAAVVVPPCVRGTECGEIVDRHFKVIAHGEMFAMSTRDGVEIHFYHPVGGSNVDANGLLWHGKLTIPQRYFTIDGPNEGFVVARDAHVHAGFFAVDGTPLVVK